MITPETYGNAAMMIYNSSNQATGYMTGQGGLSSSNIGARKGNAAYSNFDLTPQARQGTFQASIFVGLWGLSRAAFPANSDWTWISVPT